MIGDTDFVQNYTTENSERYTNEFAKKVLAYDEVDQEDLTLTITAYQAGKLAKRVQNMGYEFVSPEASAIGLIATVEDFDFVTGDQIIELDGRRVAVNAVTDEAAAAYELGVHYTVSTGEHGKSYVNILGKPDGAGTDVIVDYDRLASTAQRTNLFTESEFLVELVFLENIKPASGRTAETRVYYRVGMKLDGDLQHIGSDSGPKTTTISGTVYYDDARGGFGHVDDNVQAAA